MTKALSKKRRPGVSVRLVTQASDTPIATATTVAKAELTRVLTMASRFSGFANKLAKFASVNAPGRSGRSVRRLPINSISKGYSTSQSRRTVAPAQVMVSAVITPLNLFQNRVLAAEAPRAVSTPAGVTMGTRPRTASFRQAAAEPPQLFPFRDIAGADLQCFVQRQFSLDSLDVGRSFLDVRPGYVGTRRTPSHQFDVDRLSFRREKEVQVKLGRIRMRRALEDAGRPWLAGHTFPRPDPANGYGWRGRTDVLEMEVGHLHGSGILTGRDLLRHAGMAALEHRLVATQLLDELPAKAPVANDGDEPIVTRAGDFEIVDRELVFPIRLSEVPPALGDVGLVDLPGVEKNDDAADARRRPVSGIGVGGGVMHVIGRIVFEDLAALAQRCRQIKKRELEHVALNAVRLDLGVQARCDLRRGSTHGFGRDEGIPLLEGVNERLGGGALDAGVDDELSLRLGGSDDGLIGGAGVIRRQAHRQRCARSKRRHEATDVHPSSRGVGALVCYAVIALIVDARFFGLLDDS